MKHVVYTASPESGQIHCWKMDEQGALTLLQVVDVHAQVQPLVVSPDGRYLYAGVRPDFRVLAWRIDAEGKLSAAGQASLSGSPSHISTDRSGRWLFCASYNDACVSVSPLRDGLPGEPVTVQGGLAGCHSANIDPRNQTLFVPALKQDRICLYALGAAGELTATPQGEVHTAPGAGPRHMVFHPRLPWAYSVNELNSCVDVWQLDDASGQVLHVQSVDMLDAGFSGTRWAADIHITPDGQFLYSCDRTASTLTAFRISAGGDSLTRLTEVPTETQPRGFNIDSQGAYLVAAGQKSHHIAVYRIGAEGGLQPLKRYAVGQGPMWVVIRPLEE
ncbi:6-phosphogluconolactonase [Pantoea sp. 1.19]|uniref:6-phosphogluconolactonase n=1 Tax=Pantoea sp. 1.19 TaxID=1925589 RepID=UPI000948E430|nr:6-phosphogluconolactonase [Pantoea sp. 1.19]